MCQKSQQQSTIGCDSTHQSFRGSNILLACRMPQKLYIYRIRPHAYVSAQPLVQLSYQEPGEVTVVSRDLWTTVELATPMWLFLWCESRLLDRGAWVSDVWKWSFFAFPFAPICRSILYMRPDLRSRAHLPTKMYIKLIFSEVSFEHWRRFVPRDAIRMHYRQGCE